MNKKIIAGLVSASLAGALSCGAAYAKHPSSDEKELIDATFGVKQMIELCLFDQGFEAIDRCTTGKKATDFGGRGWDLSQAPGEYESKYVELIEVKSGVITAKSKTGKTIVIEPKHTSEDAIEWVIQGQDASVADGSVEDTSDAALGSIAHYIADNYKLFRKANVVIDVPAGEKLAQEDETTFGWIDNVHKYAWSGAKLTYENKFGDPKFASSALTVSSPELKVFAKDSDKPLFAMTDHNELFGIECTDVGLCTFGIESSAKSAAVGKINMSDFAVSIVTENINLASVMNNVCGIKGNVFDLVSLDELIVCFGDSKKSESSLLLLGENFKVSVSLSFKLDGKPIALNVMASLSGNKPTTELDEILPHIKAQLLFTADKAVFDKIPKEIGIDSFKTIVAKLDPSEGDTYKIEVICNTLDECKVNGVPLEEASSKL